LIFGAVKENEKLKVLDISNNEMGRGGESVLELCECLKLNS
jgi:hypothetical protein